ncbi:MAG: DUF1801 domain-containing protein [Bacteroidetes bacterium]|nr:DUF1801 domain-containing protein [Bacteroidota bacterium]
MTVKKQISDYIASQPDAKRMDMQALHEQLLKAMPKCRLWFLDGKDSNNKTVSNPNIGYGLYTIRYADGSEKPFYQVGLSANTSGISVYIMGLKDKDYLPKTYGKKIGKASVTGYCIKFKSLKDIDSKVLLDAVKAGVKATS